MHSKFLRTTMALLLLLLMIGYVIGEKSPQNNHHRHHHHHDEGQSSSTASPYHMDHSVLVFFTPNDLKVGNKIPIFFRATNNNKSPHFLPREESEKIPFSHSKLPFLLQLFGFSQGSSQAQAMEDTLRQCETKPIQGETRLCATSLESMLDFVHQIFGSTTNFRVLSTQNFAKYNNNNILQNYTIVDEPIEVYAPKMVACHTVPYPYVVYYCHYQESQSKVFQISLRIENENNNINNNNNLNGNNDNNIVKAIAVCHMDTSQWSINHVSFKVLGIKPGSSPICHFFPEDNLVWVPITSYHIEGSRDKVSAM